MGDKLVRERVGSEECPGVKGVIWDGRELDWVASEGRPYLRGVGVDYLLNKYFEEGWRKLLTSWRPPKKFRLGLIIPCSYGKPYSQSYIHYLMRSAIAEYLLRGDVHEIIVTNAGVVPRELDEYWPYCAYDWNPKYETEEIKRCYIEVLTRRLRGYLEKHMKWYGRLAAYLRWDSDSWRAVEAVSRELGIEIPNLAPRAAPGDELKEVSLGGLYEDEDLILVTPSALKALREGVRRILEGT